MVSGQNAAVAHVNELEKEELFRFPGMEGRIAKEKKLKQSHAPPIFAVRMLPFDRYLLQ